MGLRKINSELKTTRHITNVLFCYTFSAVLHLRGPSASPLVFAALLLARSHALPTKLPATQATHVG